ncbi:DUF2892 domain-containing protein [Halorubraceae archaeon YAN]|nr:DUF2892 domain-containing protein [Halorubraceae archaeon YAN]
MGSEQNVGGTDRLLRAAGAVVLTLVAVRSITGGRKLIGVLAALGAVGLGFNATTCFCGVNQALGIDTTASADE